MGVELSFPLGACLDAEAGGKHIPVPQLGILQCWTCLGGKITSSSSQLMLHPPWGQSKPQSWVYSLGSHPQLGKGGQS